MLRSMYRSSTPGSDDGVAYLSDEEAPASPRSVTSSHGVSYELQRSGSGVSKKSDFDLDESQDDIPPQYGSEELSAARSITSTKDYLHKFSDPMSTSFYGALPDTFETKSSQPINIQGSSTHLQTFTESPISQSPGSTESAAALPHKFLEEADKGFEQALKEHVELRGADVMSTVTAKYSYSPSKAEEVSRLQPVLKSPNSPRKCTKKDGATIVTTTTTTVTTTQGDGASSKTTTTETSTTSSSASVDEKLKEWGKPLGLPSPAPMAAESDIRTTLKKERRLVATKTRLNNEKNLRKRSESPNKAKKPSPVYVDLTYVPHNGNSYYSHVEFFKSESNTMFLRHRTQPPVCDALLEAKQTWEDKELEVTIIPTYDTDVWLLGGRE
ncbi:Microtubule-associated protein futsch [Eumeta japonica]|uniref:Microtubule-associated protein futsch n=1 Tax=Eumeta variegata TaxID=151549 RepID=A0A4C1SCK7_EUMVA|nr:Microtubule-associated protein futsch [Eumeta japonica]